MHALALREPISRGLFATACLTLTSPCAKSPVLWMDLKSSSRFWLIMPLKAPPPDRDLNLELLPQGYIGNSRDGASAP